RDCTKQPPRRPPRAGDLTGWVNRRTIREPEELPDASPPPARRRLPARPPRRRLGRHGRPETCSPSRAEVGGGPLRRRPDRGAVGYVPGLLPPPGRETGGPHRRRRRPR